MVLPVDPKSGAVLLEEAVEVGLVVVLDGHCPKAAAEVASPKIDLKFWREGLLSGVDVAGEVVVVTAKMGLNPEANRGLVLPADPELLDGVVVVAVARLEAEEAVEVPIWLGTPNRLAPATGGVLFGALET